MSHMGAALALIVAIGVVGAFGFGSRSAQPQHTQSSPEALPPGAKDVYVAGGCFWCLDGMYRQLDGVIDVESGYAGGYRPGVSYEQVCTGSTGHAETVRIIFDPNKISEDDLLRIFFTIHNPTTLNRQGPDEGTQYRSVIFYRTPEEQQLAEKVKAEIEHKKVWPDPIVTSIEPLKNYTRAEEYHQNYYYKFEHATPAQQMMMNAGYCSAVVGPHVLEFRKQFTARLKKG